jgi:sugar O-acyltransferase (sialic acid O-acetyltransferase NeuD family)
LKIADIPVPLLNANEPEARLVGIHVQEGQLVNAGQLLFSLETTKATAEIESTVSGFIHLASTLDDMVCIGDLLAVITDSNAEEPINIPETMDQKTNDIRITGPARELARQLGVDLDNLPRDRLVTEEIVRMFSDANPLDLPESMVFDPEKSILIYGGGGHAKEVIDLVRSIGVHQITGIVDDSLPINKLIMGYPVFGTRKILTELKKRGINQAANGVGGILDIQIRVNLFEMMENMGFSFPKLIHPRAFVEISSKVHSDGVQVFANAYIGSEASLLPRCMINTNAVVSHDCVIGEYSHIAPGALLAGHVQVGRKTLIGMGVTTSIGITIGDNVRIGNGAILYADVPSRTIIPAGKVWAGGGNK